MKKFDLKIYSFNEVEPISLEEIKGGDKNPDCCNQNNNCNINYAA